MAETPDLSWPHSAISLHFKVFHKTPELAWHAPTNRWLKRDDLETKIEIYDDRVQGWFLEWGDKLKAEHNAGFVVLMVATAYLEGNQQYREGRTSEGESKKFFVAAIQRIFSLTEQQGRELYREVRCGLFHDGMTKHRVSIANEYPDALVVVGDEFRISPNKFLDAVRADMTSYIAALRAPNCTALRTNFERRWNG